MEVTRVTRRYRANRGHFLARARPEVKSRGGTGGDTHGDADGDVRGGFSQPLAAQGGLGRPPVTATHSLATVTPGNRPRHSAHVPDVRDSPAQRDGEGGGATGGQDGGGKRKGKRRGGEKKKRGKLGLPGGRRAGVTTDSGTRIGLAVVARNGGGGGDGGGEGAVPTVVPTR